MDMKELKLYLQLNDAFNSIFISVLDGKIDAEEKRRIIDKCAPLVAEFFEHQKDIPAEKTEVVLFAVDFVKEVLEILKYKDVPLPEKVK